MYTRRWSIQPLPNNPNNTLVFQVRVIPRNQEAAADASGTRALQEADAVQPESPEGAMTSQLSSRSRRRSPHAGFSIVEVLVSVTVMLIIAGSIFALVDPTQGITRAQPEASDMQQRMRVATDLMARDLIMAGAGTYSGAIAGGLANFFAPIQPVRSGTLYHGEAMQRYFPDRITIAYVPNTMTRTNPISIPTWNRSSSPFRRRT